MKKSLVLFLFAMAMTASHAQNNSVILSHYVLPEFTAGYVLQKNGAKNPSILNYNSLSEEMVFESNGQKMAIAENQLSNIDSVVIQTRKFIRFDGKFVEVLASKDYTLYAEYKCNVTYPPRSTGPGRTSQTSSSEQYSTLGQFGVFYELKLPDGFKIRPYIFYWIKSNGQWNKFKSFKQLQKFYPEQKSNIKEYLKKYDPEILSINDVSRLIHFLENAS